MLRKISIIIIAIVPLNSIRIFLYRLVLNYNISYSSTIGVFNYIDVKKLNFNNANIGNFNFIQVNHFSLNENSYIKRFNIFAKLNKVVIEKNNFIGQFNRFTGTRIGLSPFKEYENLFIDNNVTITKKHLFDISDTIEIGSNVTIGGTDTQFWTHGFDLNNIKIQQSIKLSNNIYIGSRCLILLGVNICSHVSIGSGTTVSKAIKEEGFYVSSQLIKKVHSEKNNLKTVEKNNCEFIRIV